MNTGENISFDDNNFKFKSRSIFGSSEIPGMTKFLVGKGLVKNETQAMYFMIILIIIFVCTSMYIVYNSSYKETSLSDFSPTDQSILKGDLYISN